MITYTHIQDLRCLRRVCSKKADWGGCHPSQTWRCQSRDRKHCHWRRTRRKGRCKCWHSQNHIPFGHADTALVPALGKIWKCGHNDEQCVLHNQVWLSMLLRDNQNIPWNERAVTTIIPQYKSWTVNVPAGSCIHAWAFNPPISRVSTCLLYSITIPNGAGMIFHQTSQTLLTWL